MKSRKICSLLIVFLLVVTLFVACTKTDDAAQKESVTTENVAEENGGVSDVSNSDNPLEGMKFGFVGWSSSDYNSLAYIQMQNIVEEEFGVEYIHTVNGSTAEGLVSDVENLIQAGCKGITLLFCSPTVADLCTEAEVYFSTYTQVTDQEELAYYEQSPYWVGSVYEGVYEVGYNIVKALYEDGCREIAIITPAPGEAQHDLRYNGMLDFVAEKNDIVIHEYRGAEYEDAFRNMLALYPNIDGCATTSSANGYGDTIVSLIYNEGKGKIKFATTDFVSNQREAMEDGVSIFTGSGTSQTTVFCFIMMANKICGTPLTEEPQYLEAKYCNLNGIEDYEEFVKWVDEDTPWTGAELKNMIQFYNPEFTAESLVDVLNTYSLEDVITRHS